MKLLSKDQYYKVSKPLEAVTFNHLFARAVVSQKIEGLIYTDNLDAPASFYIIHPYGMSLLFGNDKNKAFNTQLINYLINKNKIRNRIEWMQVYPEDWSATLLTSLGDRLLTKKQKGEGRILDSGFVKVEEQTRVNFKFDPNIYYAFRKSNLVCNAEIFRMREDEFQNMPGTVVPKYFWQHASQFLNDGVGFSLRYNGELACTAFSAFIDNGQLELGIESAAQFRGKGFALHTCAALIDYCLENNYEPVWSCRLENTGSYKLAQKLGFVPVHYHPFYKIDI